MSPYKRKAMWWGRIRTRDGKSYRLSLETKDVTVAERLENMLRVLADQHRWALLDALRTGEVTLAEAFEAFNRSKADELDREIMDGTRDVDLSPKVTAWGKHMARTGKPSAPLQKKYLMQVRRFIPPDKPFPVKQFTATKCKEFLHDLPIGQPNRYHAALSRFAAYLVGESVLKANPLSAVERVREADPRLFELTHEEVDRVLGALPEQDRVWHALMAATGAEWGAIVAAKRRDLDPDALTFRARGTKRAARDRVVLIRKDSVAVDLLRAHWRKLDSLPDGPLFPRLTGHRSALQRLQDAAKAVGLPKMRIHDWRHVFAVQAVRDGWPYYAVAHQLGHATTLMVQRVYGRFNVTLADLRAVEHSGNTLRDTLRLVTEG